MENFLKLNYFEIVNENELCQLQTQLIEGHKKYFVIFNVQLTRQLNGRSISELIFKVVNQQ